MKKFIFFIFFFVFSINAAKGTENFPFENLKFHGDVSTKWFSEIGGYDYHSFRSEARLGCDYALADSWVSLKMKATTLNGKESAIFLDKAFMGYQFFDLDKGSFRIEIGRNKMQDMFDSKVQFESYFNGVHCIYNYSQPGLFQFILHGGPHVVDNDTKHYGCVVEGIWQYVADMPLTIKYSFIDWNAPRRSHRVKRLFEYDYSYRNSQLSISYEIYKTRVYGAYVLNHQQDNQNDAYYFGVKTGKLIDKGDFEVDINFRTARRNAISSLDCKGYKKGIQIKAAYAMLKDLNLESTIEFFDDYNGLSNNRRIELCAVYKW